MRVGGGECGGVLFPWLSFFLKPSLIPSSGESQECHPPSSLPLPFTPSQPLGEGEENQAGGSR